MSQTEITKCEKMDRETFYQYILDNFTLSGEEQRCYEGYEVNRKLVKKCYQIPVALGKV